MATEMTHRDILISKEAEEFVNWNQFDRAGMVMHYMHLSHEHNPVVALNLSDRPAGRLDQGNLSFDDIEAISRMALLSVHYSELAYHFYSITNGIDNPHRAARVEAASSFRQLITPVTISGDFRLIKDYWVKRAQGLLSPPDQFADPGSDYIRRISLARERRRAYEFILWEEVTPWKYPYDLDRTVSILGRLPDQIDPTDPMTYDMDQDIPKLRWYTPAH